MKRFSDLQNQVLVDEARRARIAAHKAELLAELTLADLRRARQFTQGDMAAALGTTQPGVSRLEHHADLYLSTLRKYVEALGGKLQLIAEFPDVRVPITTFAALRAETPQLLLPPMRLAVHRGPLPAVDRQQVAAPLAPPASLPEDSYYVYQPLECGELLARLSCTDHTDSLVLEWVWLAPALEGSAAHVRVETTAGKLLETDVRPVATGLQSIIAEDQQVGPLQVAAITLEFAEAA